MSWIAIARFKASDPEAHRAARHWEYAAEDVGLLPESNVHLEEEGEQVVLFISETLNDFFQGNPGANFS